MTIRYQCEECGSVLNIRDEKAGTTGHCPKCRAEFLVPSPGDDPAPAASESEEAQSAAATRKAKPTAAAKPRAPERRVTGADMDSDEIEQILEGKGSRPERDDYGVASHDDEDDDEDDEDDEDETEEVDDEDEEDEEDEEDMSSHLQVRRKKVEEETDWDDADDDEEEEERPKKKDRRSRHEKPVESSGSAAGIAKGLMARGDKALKLDERAGARHFGGKEGEEDGDEGFSIGERVTFFAKYLVPAAIGIAIAVGIFMWWLQSWKRGTLPDLGYVSGTVTMDGAPLPGVLVQFSPMVIGTGLDAQKATGSSSVGITDAAGKYVLTYTVAAEGAVLGKHSVQITDPSGMVAIPPNYNLRSLLQADVQKGSNTKDFPLSSKPPDGGGGTGGFSPPGR